LFVGVGVLAAGVWVGISCALKSGTSDFNCFYDAAAAALHAQDIYAAGSRGYIYPPLLAALIAPLGRLDRTSAALVWTGITGVLTLLVWHQSAQNLRDRLGAHWREAYASASLAVIVLAAAILQEFKDGNCNMLVLLAVVLAQRWLGRRPLLCGGALGLAINIKYLPLVYLPYLLARRRWAELLSASLFTAVFALAPALVFGWGRNIDYLRTAYAGLFHLAGGEGAGGASVHPLAWRSSISIPSALARGAEFLGVPSGVAWAAASAVCAATLLLAWRMYARAGGSLIRGFADARADRTMLAFEWPDLMLAALVFSPQTVLRHANLALPFVAAAGWLLISGRARRPVLLSAFIVAVFAGTLLRFWVDRVHGTPEPWRAVGGLSWCLLLLGVIVIDEAASLARRSSPLSGSTTSLPARAS
jgi:hypothetical protein